MNAANEVAVASFLKNKISFVDIPMTVRKAMDEHKVIKNPELDEILEVDKEVKEKWEMFLMY